MQGLIRAIVVAKSRADFALLNFAVRLLHFSARLRVILLGHHSMHFVLSRTWLGCAIISHFSEVKEVIDFLFDALRALAVGRFLAF